MSVPEILAVIFGTFLLCAGITISIIVWKFQLFARIQESSTRTHSDGKPVQDLESNLGKSTKGPSN